LSKSKQAQPYMLRLSNFSLLIWPSVCLLLCSIRSAAHTAAYYSSYGRVARLFCDFGLIPTGAWPGTSAPACGWRYHVMRLSSPPRHAHSLNLALVDGVRRSLAIPSQRLDPVCGNGDAAQRIKLGLEVERGGAQR
jgi:hypothetical protein